MLLDHTGERPFVLFSEDSLSVIVFTVFVPTGSDITENMVFVASARGTNICSCKAFGTAIHEISTTENSLQGSWWLHDSSEICLTRPL